VSSNTPWFFNGLRIQWFPTNKLKIEPWIINGWQSYNKFNGHMGLGGQIMYRPHEWLSMVFNNYGNGTDTLGVPGRSRLHTDDSVEVRYLNVPHRRALTRWRSPSRPMRDANTAEGYLPRWQGWSQAVLPWLDDLQQGLVGQGQICLTLGGGQMNNPVGISRYCRPSMEPMLFPAPPTSWRLRA